MVMVGIIVDTTRMHVTKDYWTDFLGKLSQASGRRVAEFHSRDFYKGNGAWRELDGKSRAATIEAVLAWVRERKHSCVLAAIDKEQYGKFRGDDVRVKEMTSPWCATAMHCALQVQKQHQCEDKNKGHTVLIFDREVAEEAVISQLVAVPPPWVDTYYDRGRKQTALDQIVDVPFFADSKHIVLAQIADLFAYILRTWAEIAAGLLKERYAGEGCKMEEWVKMIGSTALSCSTRYPVKNRCEASQLFWDLAPDVVKSIGR